MAERVATAEQIMAALPTDDQVEAIVRRISAGEVRRCIPCQADDDDVLVANALEDWKRLRAAGPQPAVESDELVDLRDRVRIQDAELERLRKYEPRVKSFSVEGDAWKFDLAGAQHVMGMFAEAFATVLYDQRAENYVETSFVHEKFGTITVTVQRQLKRTPHQFRVLAEAERDRLRNELRCIFDLAGAHNDPGIQQRVAAALGFGSISEYRRAYPSASPTAPQVPPCGGSRCHLAEDGATWIHSSKSYGTCSVRAGDPNDASDHEGSATERR